MLMTVCLTAYTQDSLRLVPVRAWQLSRMVDEVKMGRVCDSALRVHIQSLTLADSVVRVKNAEIKVLQTQKQVWQRQGAEWQDAYKKSIEVMKEEKRMERTQGGEGGGRVCGGGCVALS